MLLLSVVQRPTATQGPPWPPFQAQLLEQREEEALLRQQLQQSEVTQEVLEQKLLTREAELQATQTELRGKVSRLADLTIAAKCVTSAASALT